jgi:hypothetical protein
MRDGYENQKHAKKHRQQAKESKKAVIETPMPVPILPVAVVTPPPEVVAEVDLTSRHWQTLAVLASSLALLFWMRQDALDQYWQQTRHLELGFSKAVDHPAWQSGAKLSKDLDQQLSEQLKPRQTVKERLILSFNVLLFGLPEESAGDKKLSQHNAPLNLKKSTIAANGLDASAASAAKLNPKVGTDADAGADGMALNLSKAAGTVEAQVESPLSQFVPLNEEGRMVLGPQDKVLLVGDSMMQGVAPHVARALQNVHVKSMDLSRQSTGLTYPGYYDWPAVIKKTLEKDRISVLVVFLGANDTWDMILGGKYESFGTERWQSNYLARIESIIQTAHQQHVRVIWMGAPNMGRDKINRGVKVLNSLYAKALGEGESRYISTRESLGDDVNEYRKTITKDNGKSVVVRTEDGIHFTRDGQTILRDLVLKQFELPVISKVSP